MYGTAVLSAKKNISFFVVLSECVVNFVIKVLYLFVAFFFVFRFFFKRTDRNFIGLDKVSKYAASCKYHRDPKVCSSLRCVSNPSLSS